MKRLMIVSIAVLFAISLTACGKQATLDLADADAVLQMLAQFDAEQAKQAGRLVLGESKTQTVEDANGTHDFYTIEFVNKLDPTIKYGGLSLAKEPEVGGAITFQFEASVENDMKTYLRQLLHAIGVTQKHTEDVLANGLSVTVGKKSVLYADGFKITCETKASVLNSGAWTKSLYVRKISAGEENKESEMQIAFADTQG